ncbi:hypothetical protein [Silvibacterium sp.]|uniref:hypothetical protein n=1 Tax=Silvibacterium sp. TaxID=1964179 RepID=UPI0039E47BB8
MIYLPSLSQNDIPTVKGPYAGARRPALRRKAAPETYSYSGMHDITNHFDLNAADKFPAHHYQGEKVMLAAT